MPVTHLRSLVSYSLHAYGFILGPTQKFNNILLVAQQNVHLMFIAKASQCDPKSGIVTSRSHEAAVIVCRSHSIAPAFIRLSAVQITWPASLCELGSRTCFFFPCPVLRLLAPLGTTSAPCIWFRVIHQPQTAKQEKHNVFESDMRSQQEPSSLLPYSLKRAKLKPSL